MRIEELIDMAVTRHYADGPNGRNGPPRPRLSEDGEPALIAQVVIHYTDGSQWHLVNSTTAGVVAIQSVPSGGKPGVVAIPSVPSGGKR